MDNPNSKFLKLLEEQDRILHEGEFVKGNEQSELTPSDDEEGEAPEGEAPEQSEEPQPEAGTNLDGQALYGTILTDLIHAVQYIDRESHNEFGVELAELEQKASRSSDLADTYKTLDGYMQDLGIKE